MADSPEYVYVNQDGSARELSASERDFLSKQFAPNDGGRPYIKVNYNSRNGWGSQSGFLPRHELPATVTVQPVNPDYVPQPRGPEEIIPDYVAAGFSVEHTLERSFKITPGTGSPKEEQVERFRQLQLERQLKEERLARHPDHLT